MIPFPGFQWQPISADTPGGRGIAALLRLEGLAALIASITTYQMAGANWWTFTLLFLLPDLSMLGYLRNPEWGAPIYNAGHSYIGPAFTAGLLVAYAPAWLPLIAIWTAHIGFDRLLGYGLKYPNAFRATHLGWIGKYESGSEQTY